MFIGPIRDDCICGIQNMKTHERKKFKAPKFFFDLLRQRYPHDEYIGRMFMIAPDKMSELEEVEPTVN